MILCQKRVYLLGRFGQQDIPLHRPQVKLFIKYKESTCKDLTTIILFVHPPVFMQSTHKLKIDQQKHLAVFLKSRYSESYLVVFLV